MPSPQQAARSLRRTIPPPAPKKPKATKSFRLLKPGQFLKSANTIWFGADCISTNKLWRVESVNSLGALLKLDGHNRYTYQLMDPDWKEHGQWLRARKPKVGSGK